MKNSYFISGTDTDVGKTIFTAGLARLLRDSGVDVGIMKPFAAGQKQSSGFASEDVQMLVNAARVKDPESLVNPQFFPIPASPYTAFRNLGIKPNLDLVTQSFSELKKLHDVMLVEGMGGIMTPILEDYFVVDLIRDMKLETIIVTSSRVGTVNHTLMTVKMCKEHDVKIKGIVINHLSKDGYPFVELKRDLEELTHLDVLGQLPVLENLQIETIASTLKNNMDISNL